jgi:hypothetical protein
MRGFSKCSILVSEERELVVLIL